VLAAQTETGGPSWRLKRAFSLTNCNSAQLRHSNASAGFHAIRPPGVRQPVGRPASEHSAQRLTLPTTAPLKVNHLSCAGREWSARAGSQVSTYSQVYNGATITAIIVTIAMTTTTTTAQER